MIVKNNKKKKIKQIYRLFIKIQDKKNPPFIDKYGRKVTPVIWKEVQQVNLGSIQKPNNKLFGIKLVPIEYEEDGKPKKMFFNFFKDDD